MLVAVTPIDPSAGELCFAFHVINDGRAPIESVLVESVSYEWGDAGSSTALGTRFGPIAPGTSIEVHRETSTEVRTALTLRIRDASGERRVCAEVGRLCQGRGPLVPIPVLGRPGKLAEIELLEP